MYEPVPGTTPPLTHGHLPSRCGLQEAFTIKLGLSLAEVPELEGEVDGGGGGCWDRGPRLGVGGAGRRRFQEPLEAEPGALLWPSFPPAFPWRTSEAILWASLK